MAKPSPHQGKQSVRFKSADEDKMNHRQSGQAGLLEADGSASATEQLFDLAVGGKPMDVTIYQSLTFTRS
jgi:hypothetical protein